MKENGEGFLSFLSLSFFSLFVYLFLILFFYPFFINFLQEKISYYKGGALALACNLGGRERRRKRATTIE